MPASRVAAADAPPSSVVSADRRSALAAADRYALHGSLPHGDPAGYAAVLDRCAALAALEFDPTEGQPTTQLYPLVLAVRREIPAFKAAVDAVLTAAEAPGTAASYRELPRGAAG